MNTILIMIATTAIFFIGIQVGYSFKKNEKAINKPKVQKIEEQIQNNTTNKKDSIENKNMEEIIRLNKIMSNLDNFNGTGEGQVDVD